MTSEADLTRAVRTWLKDQPDVWFFKVHGGPYQEAGIPDLVLSVAGRFIAIELKAPHGPRSKKTAWDECTPLQRATLVDIGQAGGYAAACDTLEQVQELVAFVEMLAHGEPPGTLRPELIG